MRAILTIFQPHARPEMELEKRAPSTIEQTAPVVSANPNTPATVEAMVLQRLLAELEARAAARVPAPYFVEHVPRSRRAALVRTLFALLWALSLVLCVFVVKYLDRPKTIQLSDAAQTHSITSLTATIGDQNKQFMRMIDSVESLASAVASSSLRTNAMQAVLKRLGRDMKQPDAQPASDKPAPAPKPSSAVVSAPPQREEAPEVPMGGHHHQPIEDVVAPRYVVVHHKENGVMDYWLVPRIVSGSRVMTKVFPIAQTNMGVFVHNMEDVRDYIVTPSGDWLSASAPNGNE